MRAQAQYRISNHNRSLSSDRAYQGALPRTYSGILQAHRSLRLVVSFRLSFPSCSMTVWISFAIGALIDLSLRSHLATVFAVTSNVLAISTCVQTSLSRIVRISLPFMCRWYSPTISHVSTGFFISWNTRGPTRNPLPLVNIEGGLKRLPVFPTSG